VSRLSKALVASVKSYPPAGTTLARPGLLGWVREPMAGGWQRGVTVDPLGGLTSFAAVYACVSRIANDIAKLEPMVMERADSGMWVPLKNSPFSIPLSKPNDYQNRIQFYTWWMVTKLLYGNAYALKLRDNRTMVSRLYMLDPRRVTPMVTPEGDVYYSLSGDDLSKIPAGMVVPASEIIHDRGLTLWHPLQGVSPIHACGISATQGLRIQANSAVFFGNMSRPSGVLSAPATITDEVAARLKKDWNENFSAGNIGKLAVLGDGLKYEPMTITASDAELIEQLKWTVEDVARAFSMPLYKIGAGPVPTNNNVEALHLQYYSDCLQNPIECVELCLKEGLGLAANQRIEFDLSGLLRMDQKTKLEMLKAGVDGGLLTPNEGRAELNKPPLDGGNTVYLQQQQFSLAALAKRDARDDPFAKEPAAAPAATEPEEPDEPPDDEARALADALIRKFAELEHA
jgi:HK97 family phage portal protein